MAVEQIAYKAINIDELKEPFTEMIQSIDAVISEYENQYAP